MTKLEHDTIGNLRAGAFGAAINRAINDCMKDCEDRPDLDKVRSMVIRLDFKPVNASGLEGASSFNTVAVLPQVKITVPAQVAGAEFLSVSPGATEDGEPEISAVFMQEGLFTRKPQGGN